METVLVEGDITQQQVDVVVNAANSALLGGGGVDGAIHRAGGPEILAACREVRRREYPDGLPVGEAVATTAGDLPARWVVHTVGPVWSAGEDRSAQLRACYASALRVADALLRGADALRSDGHRATSVAFPLISAGVYGWPVDDAVRQAYAVLRPAAPEHLREARLVLFDEPTWQIAAETWAMAEAGGGA